MKTFTDQYPVYLPAHERGHYKKELRRNSLIQQSPIPIDRRVLNLDFVRCRDIAMNTVNNHLGPVVHLTTSGDIITPECDGDLSELRELCKDLGSDYKHLLPAMSYLLELRKGLFYHILDGRHLENKDRWYLTDKTKHYAQLGGRHTPYGIIGSSKSVRGLIRPEDDWVYVVLDVKNQEAKIAADLSGDCALRRYMDMPDGYLALAELFNRPHTDRARIKLAHLAHQNGMDVRKSFKDIADEIPALYGKFFAQFELQQMKNRSSEFIETLVQERVQSPRKFSNSAYISQGSGSAHIAIAKTMMTNEEKSFVIGQLHDDIRLHLPKSRADLIESTITKMKEAYVEMMRGYGVQALPCSIQTTTYGPDMTSFERSDDREFWEYLFRDGCIHSMTHIPKSPVLVGTIPVQSVPMTSKYLSQENIDVVLTSTADVTVIRSDTGTGKSTAFKGMINQYKSVLMPYHLRKLVHSNTDRLRADLKDRKVSSYKDYGIGIADDVYLTTLHSLHLLGSDVVPRDLVLWDEYKSGWKDLKGELFIETKMNTAKDNQISLSKDILVHQLREAKKVILADADICEETILSLDRPVQILDFVRPVHYKRALFCRNERYLFKDLIDKLNRNERICVLADTETVLLKIKEFIHIKYPHRQVGLVSGRTTDLLGDLALSGIYTADVLLMTHAAGCGISINEHNDVPAYPNVYLHLSFIQSNLGPDGHYQIANRVRGDINLLVYVRDAYMSQDEEDTDEYYISSFKVKQRVQDTMYRFLGAGWICYLVGSEMKYRKTELCDFVFSEAQVLRILDNPVTLYAGVLPEVKHHRHMTDEDFKVHCARRNYLIEHKFNHQVLVHLAKRAGLPMTKTDEGMFLKKSVLVNSDEFLFDKFIHTSTWTHSLSAVDIQALILEAEFSDELVEISNPQVVSDFRTNRDISLKGVLIGYLEGCADKSELRQFFTEDELGLVVVEKRVVKRPVAVINDDGNEMKVFIGDKMPDGYRFKYNNKYYLDDEGLTQKM